MTVATTSTCKCGAQLDTYQLPDGTWMGQCYGECDAYPLNMNGNGAEPSPPDNRATAQPSPEDGATETIDRDEAWHNCSQLARNPSILTRLIDDLEACGLVGEDRAAKLVYLACVSRLFERPASVVIKGPSSGGKSFTVQTTLQFFPERTYEPLTSGSEHSLAYIEEPLAHRMLVIYEAAGMSGEKHSYFIRTLLSEGHIRHRTVEKTAEGFKGQVREVEGPIGLIVTTTDVNLHPENETRLISLTANDTPAQTEAVLKKLGRADEDEGELPDLTPWLALQDWIEAGDHRVVVPFGEALAELIPPVAVRLRRDFTTIMQLVRAHALLHQANRERDDKDRIVATVEDYAVIRELMLDVISDGVEATVKPAIRETVEAVERMFNALGGSVTQKVVADALELDKGTVSRRVRVALEAGYLVNNETREGRPHRLAPGESLPDDEEILPPPEKLRERCAAVATDESPETVGAQPNSGEELHGCTVAEGVST
jgi:hypothetical protein